MSSKGQFSLFSERRFLPYFVTQALGAFNDNLYKNTLLLFIALVTIHDQQQSTFADSLRLSLLTLNLGR